MPSLKVVRYSILGELIKLLYKFRFKSPSYGINTEKRQRKVIVSLTSYGRRVKDTVCYTIISLLKQTYKPDEVILWLDNDNWSIENIPLKLKNLTKYGLTIKFCDDLRSYKKLLPVLESNPNDLIITVDDDIYYKKDLIEVLVTNYHKRPNFIHGFMTSRINFDLMGNKNVYWLSEGHPYQCDIATGCGGIIYSKELLYKDTTNVDLIQKLAPNADDIWFYFMEVLNGTHVNMVVNDSKKLIFYPLDSFYQRFHSNSNLNSTNLHQMGNNSQIELVMKHYNITPKQLRSFSESNPALRYN